MRAAISVLAAIQLVSCATLPPSPCENSSWSDAPTEIGAWYPDELSDAVVPDGPRPLVMVAATLREEEGPHTPGWLAVRFWITEEGRTADLEVVASCPNASLRSAALRATRYWRYLESSRGQFGCGIFLYRASQRAALLPLSRAHACSAPK